MHDLIGCPSGIKLFVMHRLGCNKTLGISISQGYGEGFKTNRFLSLELLIDNNLYYLK